MFGGQDDGQNGATSAPTDDTLNGVTDLVGGIATPGPGDVGYVHTPVDPAPVNPQPEQTLPAQMPEPETQAPMPVTSDSDDNDDLLDLKQRALQQLSPLLGHLEQTPEEKFRTTMMMIQASDNRDLLKEAYEAAQSITDNKVKAQALLDVVNEINYFTQKDAQ
jgi:hypothetical protein